MPEPLPLWKQWSNRASASAVRCDEIPERGEDFATSAQDSLEKIAATIERNQAVTPDQMRAVENIEGGIAKWLDR